jgi:hypothetical protein
MGNTIRISQWRLQHNYGMHWSRQVCNLQVYENVSMPTAETLFIPAAETIFMELYMTAEESTKNLPIEGLLKINVKLTIRTPNKSVSSQITRQEAPNNKDYNKYSTPGTNNNQRQIR